MPEPASAPLAKVFISYSRKDFDLVSRLVDALSERDGIDVFRDTDDILPTEEWQDRLAQLIAEADTIVFALSPNSVASEVCKWEIEQGELHNKRFAPIVIADVEPQSIPKSLSKYNYIFFNKEGVFDSALEHLVTALDTDIDWIREHTRLGELARRWEARGHKGQPLRGPELADAEAWLAAQPPNAPAPTALHQAFIQASRRAATRRQQVWVGGSLAAMGVMAVLTVFAFQQRNIAIENEGRANRERDRAEANLEQALEAADTLVVQIAEGLKHLTGVPITFTRTILERAEAVLGGVEEAGGDAAIRHRQAVMLISFVGAYETLGDLDEAAARAAQALEIMHALAGEAPDNRGYRRELAAAHDKMGDVLAARGMFADALEHYRTGLGLAERLVAEAPQEPQWRHMAALAHVSIGDALAGHGHVADALGAYERSHDVFAELVGVDPVNAQWQQDLSLAHNKIADMLRDQGDLDRALERYRESLEIVKRLAVADPRNAGLTYQLVIRHERIGDVLMAQGRLEDALAAYNERHDIISALAATDPHNATWQRDLSVSHERIGEALAVQGKPDEALASFGASLDIRMALAARDGTNTVWQRDVAVSHNKIGDLHYAQDRLDEALQSYRASELIRARLVETNPDVPGWLRDLSATHDRIGNVHFKRGNLEAALASYQTSLEFAGNAAELAATNLAWQRDIAVMHNRIGNVQAELGDRQAAIESFRASLAIAETIVAMEESNTQWTIDLVISHFQLARMDDDALTHWRAMVELLSALEDQDLLSPVHKQWLNVAEAKVAVLGRE